MSQKSKIAHVSKDIIDLYKSGRSLSEIASIYEVAATAVYYLLVKNKTQRRSRSQANALKWTSEARQKQSASLSNNSNVRGKHWTIDRPIEKPSLRGENNPFWKGGKTKLSVLIRGSGGYRIWRKRIFERDQYTCVFCNARNGVGSKVFIEADHIQPLSKLIDTYHIQSLEQAIACEALWDLENGRTLCQKCHEQTDTYGPNL